MNEAFEPSVGLLIAGKLVVDEVLHCARAPLPGTAQRALSREISGGGQVWHTALAAAARVPVTVTGWCGDDPDTASLRGRLREHGVRDALVVAGTASRAVVLVGPDGERTIVSHTGTGRLAVHALDVDAVLREQKWLHLDGYALDEAGGDTLVGLARAAAALGIPVSLEPPATHRIEQRRPWLVRLPALTALLGRPDEVAAAQGLLTAPSRFLVTHDGGRDVVARGGGQRWSAPVPRRPVAALGAGDRFAGGWLSAMSCGADVGDALAAGVAAAHRES